MQDNTIVDIYIKEHSFKKIDDDVDNAYKHTVDTCEILKKHFPDEIEKIDVFILDLEDKVLQIKDFDNAKFDYINCGVRNNNIVWIQNSQQEYTYFESFKSTYDAFKFLYLLMKDSAPKNKDILNNNDWKSNNHEIYINEDEIPF